MSPIVVSTQVAAPLERVFEVFTDLANAAERIPSITELEILSDGPFGDGTRWRETRVIMKKEATEEMWVTGFNPPHGYTVEAQSHGMLYQTRFDFEFDGERTKVSWTFDGKPLTIMTKLTAPIFAVLFRSFSKRCMLEDMEALRDVCESQEAELAAS